MESDKVSFKKFIKSNRILFFIIILVMLFSYGYAITIADDLSIDEDITANSTIDRQKTVWYGFGRYGIPIVYKVFFPRFAALPFFNMLLSVCAIGLTAFIMCYFLSKILNPAKVPKLAYYFFAAMVISYPSSIDYLSFNNLNFSVALGLLLTGVAVYIVSYWVLNKESIVYGLLGLILSSFTISIYQSFVGVYLVFAVAFVLAYIYKKNILKEEQSFKRILVIILKYLIILAVAVALYYAVNWLILKIMVRNTNGYTESLIQMGSFKQIIYNLYFNLKYLLIEGGVRGGENITYVVLVFILSQIGLLFKNGLKNRTAIIILSFALIFAPFALAIILPGIMVRALTGLSIMVGFAGFFAIVAISMLLEKIKIKKIDYKKIVFGVLAVLTIFVCYMQMYRTNLYYYGTHVRYQRDEAFAHMLAADIIEEIEDVKPDLPVFVLGEYEIAVANNIDRTAFTGSFFSYDQVPIRVGLFMRYLGYKFEMPDQELFDKAKDYADVMPAWPKDGSIKETEECIIVKLSDKY